MLDRPSGRERAFMKKIKSLTVRDVKKLPTDESFSIVGIASRLVKKKDRNDKPYWDITLMDGTGEIEGKIWGNSSWWDLTGGNRLPIDPLADNGIKFEGSTVGLQGRVVEFRDQPQYNFNDVYYVDQEKYPPHSFVRRSPISDEKLEQMFRGLLDGMGEPLRGFVEAVFFKHDIWRNFKAWPAAVSLHHAYVAGLLEHSLSVAAGAKSLAENYVSMGAAVDIDLVTAGALLHDIGKLDAYALNPNPQMTTVGNTADHIMLGYHKLMQIAEEEGLDPKLTEVLGHIIVSHHGRREYGSPVLPGTSEALIVNAADDLDFKMFVWRSQIDGLDSAHDITDYMPLLERRFWRGTHDSGTLPGFEGGADDGGRAEDDELQS